jgi:hypothetical protein
LDPPSIRRDEPASINLRQCGTIKLSLPEESADLRVESTANVQRIFAAGSQAMYCDGDGRPVITRRCSGKTAAYFCGLGAAPDTAPIIGEIIRHACRWIGVMQPPIRTTGESVFWNGTTGGYIVAANCSDSPSNITIVYKPCTYWDVIQQRLVGEADACTALAPHSIRVLRRVAKRSKLYDVDGATCVHSIADGACRAELTLDTGPKTTLIVRCPPGEVLVDNSLVETSVELCEGYSKVRLRGVEPGRHVVTLRW